MDLKELWNNYNRIRTAGDKKAATKLLLDFISLLKEGDKAYLKTFTDEICTRLLETNHAVLSNNGTAVSENSERIQHPLFKDIIVPVLAEQYLNNSPLHIKWIGQLEQFFYSDGITADKFLKQIKLEGHFPTLHFFEKSFSIDNNQDALKLLLKRKAQDIGFYIHELPFILLIEPEDFDSELTIFRNYWNKSDEKKTWQTPLENWENIAKHWREYFTARNDYKDFMDYQQLNGIEL